MVLIKSPKGIWRNHPAEWLEYKPGAIKPTTRERAKQDVQLYRGYILKMLEELDAMNDLWTRKIPAQENTPFVHTAA